MRTKEIYRAIDGLMAYDTGSVDSGIHDESLRQQVKATLNDMPEKEFRLTISRFVRKYFLSEDALRQGYGVEDVRAFLAWMDDYMDISI